MAHVSASSLKSGAITRLLTEMISSIKTASGQEYLVLVVDEHSVKILSAALSMFAITQQGVMVIEKLELDRKIMGDVDALYFLTPTNQTITRMVQDFKSKRQYRFAHICWSADLNDRQMDFIANSDMIPFIKTFKIAHLDFLVSDPDIFHLGMPSALGDLYTEKSSESIEPVATKLAQVCGVLQELPYICYHQSSPLTQSLALATQQRVDLLFASVPSLSTTTPRATLLILDRNYDLTTPLMHDTHYETLVHDLLPVKEDNSVAYYSVDSSGEARNKAAILSDKDELWMSLKYNQIDEAVDSLGENFQRFAEGHGDLKELQVKHARVSNTEKMAKIIKALPQYQEMLSKYSLHMNLADSCMDAFTKTEVKAITELEQKMLTGVDPYGAEVKVGAVSESLFNLLGAVTKDELRLRLVLMYCLCYELSEQDRRRLFDVLKQAEIQAVQNLRLLGIEVQAEGRKTVARTGKRAVQESKARVKASQNVFSYAVPKLEEVLKNAVSGVFSNFLFTKESPEQGAELEVKPNMPKSLRKPKANTSFAGAARGDSKGRVIVFVVGGLSYAECRIAAAAAAGSGVQVVIGGTKLESPDEFASHLMGMHGRGLQGAGLGLTEVQIDLA